MNIEELDKASLDYVLNLLSPKECCTLACVSHSWKSRVENHPIWPKLASNYFGLETPAHARAYPTASTSASTSPDNDPDKPLTFKAAFIEWNSMFGLKYGTLFPRVWNMWKIIEEWTRAHAPSIYNSLAEGASESALDSAERNLAKQLPPALRLIYRLHNGQNLQFDTHLDSQSQEEPADFSSIFWGLFGGYQLYDHLACTRFLPLHRLVHYTQHYTRVNPRPQIMFAADFQFKKFFLVNSTTGDLSVNSLSGELLRAAPEGRMDSPCISGGQSDAVLRWMEHYAECLRSGVYRAGRLLNMDPSSAGISLFPRVGSGSSLCVTPPGVQVEAGCLLVPEKSKPPDLFFSYSIKLSMLSEAEQISRATSTNFTSLKSCQLKSRHWVIIDADNDQKEVRGDAVIGLYPLLEPGQPAFEYQSGTPMDAVPGSMRGDFRFVPGTIDIPSGEEFDVMVAPFDIALPEFIM